MADSPHHSVLHHPTGNDAATSAAIALLIHYFDLAPASAQLLAKKWLANYSALWIRAAVTEALYQGRYKPVSVEQILAFWQRRGKAISHFNKEFETIIAVPLKEGLGNEAIEEVTATNGQPSLDLESLAAGLSTAEQAKAESDSVPRPRLMLPGELPGKGLAQKSSSPTQSNGEPRDSLNNEPLSNEVVPIETVPTEISSNSTEATVLVQPKGFGSILDPRPPVTQETEPALVARPQATSAPPLTIGPFTPAADPSGFSSRLKAVVEQAIAKQAASRGEQPKTEAEPSSLGDAIKTQIASDPILSHSSSGGDPRQDLPGASDVTVASIATSDIAEPSITFENAPNLVSNPEVVEVGEAVESSGPAIIPVPLVSETPVDALDTDAPEVGELNSKELEQEATATAALDPASPSVVGHQPVAVDETDPWDTINASTSDVTASDVAEAAEELEAATALEAGAEPLAIANPAAKVPDSQLTQEQAGLLLNSQGNLSQGNLSLANDIHAQEVQLTAAFEDRFSLSDSQVETSPREKDEIDLALDQRLGVSFQIDRSEHRAEQVMTTSTGLETSTDDLTLDEVEDSKPPAVIDSLSPPESESFLNGDALNRHLEADPLEANSDQDAGLIPEEAFIQDEALPLAEPEPSLQTAPSQSLEASASEAAVPEHALLAENAMPVSQSEVPPIPEGRNETALAISQVSNLMAGLSQLHRSNPSSPNPSSNLP